MTQAQHELTETKRALRTELAILDAWFFHDGRDPNLNNSQAPMIALKNIFTRLAPAYEAAIKNLNAAA